MVNLSLRFFWIREHDGGMEFAFCGCFKTRVGVFVICCQGITLMLITTLINLYSENGERVGVKAVQYCLLAVYLFVMYAGFVFAFVAAFWEIGKYIKMGAYLLSAGTVIYIIFTILSFIPHYRIMKYVCPGLRCPDHHWLHYDRWRSVVIELEHGEREAAVGGGELFGPRGLVPPPGVPTNPYGGHRGASPASYRYSPDVQGGPPGFHRNQPVQPRYIESSQEGSPGFYRDWPAPSGYPPGPQEGLPGYTQSPQKWSPGNSQSPQEPGFHRDQPVPPGYRLYPPAQLRGPNTIRPIYFDLNNMMGDKYKVNVDKLNHSLIEYANSGISKLVKGKTIEQNNVNSSIIAKEKKISNKKRINLINTEDEYETDDEEHPRSCGNILFIIISVLYVVIYLGYLLYTILTFLAFAHQLEKA